MFRSRTSGLHTSGSTTRVVVIERHSTMNTHELQQLKMAWIAAKEAGDTHTQVRLLHDHPEAQADLIDFIAAYAATDIAEADVPLLPLTQRAAQTALERVFDKQTATTTAAN